MHCHPRRVIKQPYIDIYHNSCQGGYTFSTNDTQGLKPMKGLPTDLEMIVLALLIGQRDMYGLEMVKKDDRIGENSVYVVLTRMVARGFVTARYETDKEANGRRGPKRRLYKITAFGHQQYDARIAGDREAAATMATQGIRKPVGAI
jgi:DNA-binding PadR family transcriptional regulator